MEKVYNGVGTSVGTGSDWCFRLLVEVVIELNGLFAGLLVGLEFCIGSGHLPDTSKG